MGIPAFFNFGSSPDDKNSGQVIAHALQGGTRDVPDRDWLHEDG